MNDQHKRNQWVDLHTHTDKSDGTYEPSNLVQLAIAKDLAIIAITDHDTIAGVREAVDFIAKQKSNIKIIRGIEISAESSRGTLHILGYHIDIDYPPLLTGLEELRIIRAQRNTEIVAKLNRLGFEVGKKDLDDCSANNDSQGRPHIAKILVKKGIVSSIDQAFAEYLGKNKKAYVPKKLYSAEEAISLIHRSGGKAFVAHPASLNLEGKEFDDYLARLIGFGLDGIEVYAPLHSTRQIKQYEQIARSRGLMISAGSDFHGAIKPTIELGCCTKGKRIPASQLSRDLVEF